MVAWNWEGVEGVSRFLKRVWKIVNNAQGEVQNGSEAKIKLARLINKIEADIEATKFNTAVAAAMEFVNWWNDNPKAMGREDIKTFLLTIAPMAPFLAEELYKRLGYCNDELASIHTQSWPNVALADLEDEMVTVVVQVDGKMRGRLVQPRDRSKEETEKAALEIENVGRCLTGEYKMVFVPGKIINFITK